MKERGKGEKQPEQKDEEREKGVHDERKGRQIEGETEAGVGGKGSQACKDRKRA